MKRLPPSELNIMVIIWEANEPVTVSYITERLEDETELTVSALHSYLNRLVDKGFLSRTKQKKINVYQAVISESEYQKVESSSTLKKLFKGSLTGFIASLYSADNISKDDLKELKTYIEQYMEADEDDH